MFYIWHQNQVVAEPIQDDYFSRQATARCPSHHILDAQYLAPNSSSFSVISTELSGYRVQQQLVQRSCSKFHLMLQYWPHDSATCEPIQGGYFLVADINAVKLRFVGDSCFGTTAQQEIHQTNMTIFGGHKKDGLPIIILHALYWHLDPIANEPT
jgi:hypothetical protein